MDFDPTAFLSMAMTEDQDAVYTAPDVPQGVSPIKIPQETITVEGGLQMEQDMQIPVPMFELLQQDEPMDQGIEEQRQNENGTTEMEESVHIDVTETENSTTPQPSPGERTSSPCSKKVIHTTHEETRFRKDLYCGHYERVKLLRLHCSICDKHLGCAPWITERQMRMHKLLSVAVCRKCFNFYGDINFPIKDGSEIYCCWCGEGGECFCCSTCPKIVCKKCIRRNFDENKINEIDLNDDWSCFVCKPEDIWPHRALLYGLQRWGRGMRQLVALLPKEEKQAKLSLDTSHCCPKTAEVFNPVGLPFKSVLKKIPLHLIAVPYHTILREVLSREDEHKSIINGMSVPNSTSNNQVGYGAPYMNKSAPMVTEIPPVIDKNLPHQVSRNSAANYQVKQQKHIQRQMTVANRPAPYQMNRQLPPLTQHCAPPLPQYSHRATPYRPQQPYKVLPSLGISRPPYQPQPSDLERESILHRSLQAPLFEIDWLEKGIEDVKDALRPTMMLLEQFSMIKNELASDFDKLTSYSDRLSYNIKIGICNLAKTNQDIIESQKKVLDNRVSSVVSNIQLSVVKGLSSIANVKQDESSSTGSNPIVIDSSSKSFTGNYNSPPKTPEKNKLISVADQTTPATPASSTGEDVEDVTIAMFCETVYEVEDNKENKNDRNKDQTVSTQESQQAKKET